METETIFRILLAVLIVAYVIHRGYYARKHSEAASETLKKREEYLARGLAGLFGLIWYVAMIVYIANPAWLAWAALPLPIWLRWTGVGIGGLGFGLLQWAQNAMGKNWSDTPRMIKEQTLVTSGPYRWIRHPIYTAMLMILGATFFISANWLIGLSWLGMAALEITSRIRFEEALMLEYFGDQYREYMKHTGRFLPKIG